MKKFSAKQEEIFELLKMVVPKSFIFSKTQIKKIDENKIVIAPSSFQIPTENDGFNRFSNAS